MRKIRKFNHPIDISLWNQIKFQIYIYTTNIALYNNTYSIILLFFGIISKGNISHEMYVYVYWVKINIIFIYFIIIHISIVFWCLYIPKLKHWLFHSFHLNAYNYFPVLCNIFNTSINSIYNDKKKYSNISYITISSKNGI